MSLSRRGFVIGTGLLLAPSLHAQPAAPTKAIPKPAPASRRLAIVGAKLLRAGQPELPDATVVIEGSTIRSVGAGVTPEASAERIDAKGKILTAGFTDLLTGVGLVEIDLESSSRHDTHESSDPVRAAFEAADGYDSAASAVAVTRRAGVTSVGIVPRGGLISGQSAWVDLDGDDADQALVARRMALHVLLDDPGFDAPHESVGTSLLRLRELFDDARAFTRNAAAFERNQLRKLSSSRLDLTVVQSALARKLPVVFHVDRAADILSVLRLVHAEKLRAMLASCAEGWKVARQIAAAKLPAIVYPLDNLPRSFSSRSARDDNAARLHAAGVPTVIASGETHNSRKLRQIAGNAIRAGLPHDAALTAVTLAPARAVGLERTHGAVEPGRVANLVVWSGDPFELSTRAETVLIRGRQVPLESRQTALFRRYRSESR